MENEFLLCPRRTNGGDGNAGAPHRRAHGPGAISVALGVALAFGRPTAVAAAEFLLRMGDLQVPAGTVVHGAAIAVGGTAYVDGTVEGDAIALGGNVDVSGHVTGSVRADGGSVILHSTATVDGEAAAFGGTVVREPGAAVGGRRSAPAPPEPGFPMRDLWGLGALAVGLMVLLKPLLWLMYFLFLAGLVGSAWMIAVLFPRAIARFGAVLDRDPVGAFLAGLLGWPVSFVVAVLLARPGRWLDSWQGLPKAPGTLPPPLTVVPRIWVARATCIGALEVRSMGLACGSGWTSATSATWALSPQGACACRWAGR